MRGVFEKKVIAAMVVTTIITGIVRAAGGDDRGWQFERCRIQVIVALDASTAADSDIAAELPRYLQQRAEAAVGVMWSLDVAVTSSAQRPTVMQLVQNRYTAAPPGFDEHQDKLILISVEKLVSHFEITTKEYDGHIDRWSVPIRRQARQGNAICEEVFASLLQTVSPLVHFDLDPDDAKKVIITLRGAALPQPVGATAVVQPGDILLPIMRRTTREGQVAAGGVQPVPWTFLEMVQLHNGRMSGRIHSGSRRPFGTRRQGRTEQIAAVVRAEGGSTSICLRSRTSKEKPLVGYEIYSQNVDEPTLKRVGMSDEAGRLDIGPGTSRVQLVFVKNGGQLLARVPIVPGSEQQIILPLPDDDMRLEAEARLAVLREELVDVVARRNILIARVKQKIEKQDFEGAEILLRSLDALPGKSQFDLTISTEERLLRSDDPQIQRRIDNLFKATRILLTQFLDVRAINEIHDELRVAREKKAA